jgi:hypothetical protein
MTAAVSECRSMYCSSGEVNLGLSGTMTAPSLAAAKMATTNSGQLGQGERHAVSRLDPQLVQGRRERVRAGVHLRVAEPSVSEGDKGPLRVLAGSQRKAVCHRELTEAVA